MSSAILRNQTTVIGTTTVVPIRTEREEAEEFSALVIDIAPAQLARAARRTKDAAAKWSTGRSLPNTCSLFHMVRSIPAVRNWALGKMGVREMPEFLTPELLTTMMACLHQVAYQQGPDGDAARAALHKFYGGRL